MSRENTQSGFLQKNHSELNLFFSGFLLALAQGLFYASTEFANAQRKADVVTPGLLAGVAGIPLGFAAYKAYRLKKESESGAGRLLMEAKESESDAALPLIRSMGLVFNKKIVESEIKMLSAIGLTLICAAMPQLLNGAVDAINETAISKLTVGAMSLFATHMMVNLYRLVQNREDFAGAMINNIIGMAGVLSFFIVNGEAVSRLEGKNKIPPALALGAASMFALIMGHGTLSLLASRESANTTVNEAREPEAVVVDVSAASNKVSLFPGGQSILPGGIPSRAAGIGPGK